MDETFFWWLSGFIDGEGCFRVHKEKSGGYYACHFTLKVRDDERPILEQIVTRTGIGHLKPDLIRNGSKPALVWVVQSKAECLKLVGLLDRYPLRAKKRRDYDIWREAALYWTQMKKGSRWHGPRDWTEMIAFKKAIEDTRTYR